MSMTWILVADSGRAKFLGLLRRRLSRQVEKLVTVAAAKDVAWLDARSIAEYIGAKVHAT
jgi:hypothetical protein